MVNVLATFVRAIDSLNNWVGKVVRFLWIGMLLVLLHEIVARYFFNSPTIWGVEVLMFILATYFLMAGGYALLHGSHIRMDVFYSQWSPRRKAIADLATFPLAAIYTVVLIWSSSEYAIEAIMRQQHAATTWGPPLYPFKAMIPIAFSLLLLQVVAFFIRDLFFVLKGKHLE